MKRLINNPYKVNWKMYGLLTGISILIMIISVICNSITDGIISDVVKNLTFGCVASTLIAFLIEIENTKEKNARINNVYDAVYAELKYQILLYIETWARLCSVAFKDKDYRHEKHTWIEWYEATKSEFMKCNADRQSELMIFFNKQLLASVDGIQRALRQIENQQIISNINEIYDENIRDILGDYSFEFFAAKLTLESEYDKDYFWNSFDAIRRDLEKYIYNWIDIRYYNYYRFTPYSFCEKEEIRHAILESEK